MNNKKPLAFALRGFGICLIAGAGCISPAARPTMKRWVAARALLRPIAARLTRSGFLSDYARLKPVAALDGIECWRDPNLDPKRFDKVLVSRIVVSLSSPKTGKEGEQKTIDPNDLKTLTDYFYGALVKALKPQCRSLKRPGQVSSSSVSR